MNFIPFRIICNKKGCACKFNKKMSPKYNIKIVHNYNLHNVNNSLNGVYL